MLECKFYLQVKINEILIGNDRKEAYSNKLISVLQLLIIVIKLFKCMSATIIYECNLCIKRKSMQSDYISEIHWK